jgi:mono/diheme cytochrome c family protein
MTPVAKAFLLLVAVTMMLGATGAGYVMWRGVSAREQPGTIETYLARTARWAAIARRARALHNPVVRSPDVIAEARAHFADHCAGCHANDGSGQTAMGQGMWPKAPDMRLESTQRLSDGQLFWIIENGIRFTGMPGWGNGTADGALASWRLVHFIRHLPELTPSEIRQMEESNPQAPDEIRERLKEEEFLNGGAEAPAPPAPSHTHGGRHD